MALASIALTLLKKKRRLLVFIFLAILQTFFLLEFIGYNKNTLSKKHDWASVKLSQQLAATGSAHFMLTRNGLYQNQLHLGAWHGHQLLSLTQEQSPKEISFDFFLPEAGSLYFLFNIQNNQMMGLKLSPTTGGLSFFFEGSRQEGFHSKNYTDLLLTRGWHHFLIKKGDSHSDVFLDGQKSNYPFPILIRDQFIAFHGGVQNVIVDNFQVLDETSVVIDENFSYDWSWLSTLLIFVICLCLQIFISGILQGFSQTVAFRIILFNLVFYLCLLPLFAFDYYYWSKIYAYNTFAPFGENSIQTEKAIEHWRQWFFREVSNPDTYKGEAFHNLSDSFRKAHTDWDGQSHFQVKVITQIAGIQDLAISQIPVENYRGDSKKANEFRLGFLGTSQTYGKGASHMEQTLAAQVHKNMAQKETQREFKTYNFSEAGSTSSELFGLFKNKIEQSHLDVLLINLGFNDSDPELFKKNILMFKKHFSSLGIQTYFLTEPTSEPSPTLSHRFNLLVLRDLALEKKIELWDLAQYMESEKDSGLLWWDIVHLTSLGQKRAAAWLTQKLSPLID